MPLIEDIRTHILDPKFPLTSILREALVLARKLRSAELAKWVDSELGGFQNQKALPDYRTYYAHSLGNGISGRFHVTKVPLPTHILPDNMRSHVEDGIVTGGVRELESLLESNQTSFVEPWPSSIIHYFNNLPQVNVNLWEAYKVIPRGAVEHVLDTVRTRLLQFVVEIEELNPNAGEIPSLEKVPTVVTQQIFERVIMNEHYHDNAQKIEGIQGSNLATGQARISSSQASYITVADASAAVQSLKIHLDDVAEAQRLAVLDAIDLLTTAIENNSSVPKSRVVAAAETIANASDQMKRALREVSIGAAGSLASSVVWDGIRYAIGAG